MKALAKAVFDYLLYSETPEMVNFKLGFLTAVSVILAGVLFILILRFIFRYPRRSKGVAIKGQAGDIFITASAVSDLAKSVIGEYELVEVSKVLLLEDRKSTYLDIHIVVEDDKESLYTAIAEEMRTELFDTLLNRFGIEIVKKINLRIKKVESQKKKF